MAFEVVPYLTASESDAIRTALAEAGVRPDEPPVGYTSAWRRAAVAEAVEDELERSLPAAGYAPSPRSTRGATRA